MGDVAFVSFVSRDIIFSQKTRLTYWNIFYVHHYNFHKIECIVIRTD